MPKHERYDPVERSVAKERARVVDAAELAADPMIRRELTARNGFFSTLEVIEASVIHGEDFD